MNYYYEDFTLNNYRKLLQLAKKSYSFASYPEYDCQRRQILLRHDVDYSMCRAVPLAEIEKEEGVKSTYFVFSHSEGYNLFETEVSKMLKKIIGFGHDVGLHIDYGFYREIMDEQRDAEKVIKNEIAQIENTFSCKVSAVSFHQPEHRVALNLTDDRIAGVVNAYSEYIASNYQYCSDSNGYWRFLRLEDLLMDASEERMQILLHPIWWTNEILTPAERVSGYYQKQAEHKYDLYCEDMRKCKRINIGEGNC